MYLLKEIIDRTHAHIVLHSSWRTYLNQKDHYIKQEINDIFLKYQLYIHDITYDHLSKSESIEYYLNEHKDIENYIIVDDDYLSLDNIKDHIIKTSLFVGLTKEIKDEIIERLGE